MSFFNLFKKKEKAPTVIDKIWINQAAKERGCLQLVKERSGITLVAWSSLTYNRFRHWLHEENGLSTEILEVHSTLPTRMYGKDICFLEHHLFYQKEIALIKSWKCNEALFLNSLDDPVFFTSNAERIATLMERMGVEEDEVIEHPMVTKSIKRAQEKMEKEGGVKDMSESMREWWKGIR